MRRNIIGIDKKKRKKLTFWLRIKEEIIYGSLLTKSKPS